MKQQQEIGLMKKLLFSSAKRYTDTNFMCSFSSSII